MILKTIQAAMLPEHSEKSDKVAGNLRGKSLVQCSSEEVSQNADGVTKGPGDLPAVPEHKTGK